MQSVQSYPLELHEQRLCHVDVGFVDLLDGDQRGFVVASLGVDLLVAQIAEVHEGVT